MDLFKRRTPWLPALFALCFIASVSLAQAGFGVDDAIYVDFGSSGNSTPGNWNNMTSTSGTLENVTTDSGVVTDIDFSIPDRFNGVNENGTTAPDAALGLPMEATRNSFFGNDVDWSGLIEPTAQLVISGLDPSNSYELTLFSSRMSVGDNRQTQYAISGDGGLQETLYLDPANNVDNDIQSKPIRPTASGQITIDIQKGPDNNNGYGFYYLGVLILRVSQNLAANQPNPAMGASDVPYYTDLSWAAGQFAATHDVYFGTNMDDVSAATVDNPLGVLMAEGLTETSFALDPLEIDTPYFWRVDEVNSPPDRTVFKGAVWIFNTEPLAYPVTDVSVMASSQHDSGKGAVNTVNGSGLNADDQHSDDMDDMWLSNLAETEGVWVQYDLGQIYKLDRVHVWNHNSQTERVLGYGIKDALIEISTDGDTWTELKTAELPQATGLDTDAGADLPLDGVMAQYVRITALSNYSILGLKQFGLSEVRFFSIPVLAREPNPADDTTSNGVDIVLQWRAGREAIEHEVLFSDDKQAVNDGSAWVGTADLTFDVGTLDLGTPYFWKINAVGDTTYEGDLWSFRTPDHIMIDDFEMYKAEEGLRIWEHWIDGFDNPAENGAVVGNNDDAERSVVYEGSQSMPFTFDNTTAPRSEVTRFFDAPLDLTLGNPESLKLQIRGDAPGFVENADGSMTLGAAGVDIWNTADDFRFVYKRLSGDGSITARIDSCTQADVWTKAGIMIRENLSADASNSYSFVTPTGRVGTQWRVETFGTTVSTRSETEGEIALPYWVRLTRNGHSFKGEQSADGTHWQPMFQSGTPTLPTEMEIFMIPDVYIGLAVTSHMTGVPATAILSNVSTTGSVDGPWISEAIGADTHPNNQAAPMYVTLTDTTGHEKTFDHPNPEATILTDWDEWLIPMSALGPVNPRELDSITVGVGSPGVEGKVYIDAIRTHGAPLDATE